MQYARYATCIFCICKVSLFLLEKVLECKEKHDIDYIIRPHQLFEIWEDN
jgi:hypothetical protein